MLQNHRHSEQQNLCFARVLYRLNYTDSATFKHAVR